MAIAHDIGIVKRYKDQGIEEKNIVLTDADLKEIRDWKALLYPASNGKMNPQLDKNWTQDDFIHGMLKGYVTFITENWTRALKRADDLAEKCKPTKNDEPCECYKQGFKVEFKCLDIPGQQNASGLHQYYREEASRQDIISENAEVGGLLNVEKELGGAQRVPLLPTCGTSVKFKCKRPTK